MLKYENHSLWCIKCGNQAIPIMRKAGHMHKKFHRKKMYCPHCRTIVNCVECRNDSEIWEFKQNFEKGVYKDEAEKPLPDLRDTWEW